MSETNTETVSCFRAWRFNRSTGNVEGTHPLDRERLPLEHCRLIYNEAGRLLRLEDYRAEYVAPAVKLFGYNSPESDHIAEALDYNPDGTLRTIHRYEYDSVGRMIDRVELDGNERLRGHVTSSWDENRHEIEECVYRADGAVRSRHCYQHDERGFLTVEHIYDGEGNLEGWREIGYDDRENVLEKRWYTPDGALQSQFMHAYDGQSRVVRSQLFDGDGTLKGTMEFSYDEWGNPVKGATQPPRNGPTSGSE